MRMKFRKLLKTQNKLLKKVRELTIGHSQKELADLIGLDESVVSRFFNCNIVLNKILLYKERGKL